MPIVGFYCPACRMRVPLDHYETCGAVHPDFAAAVVADSKRERAAGIHVTTVIGCPRRAALEESAELYVNPLTYNAVLGGTAWHSLMETASTRPDLCEVEVWGVVEGVELVGKIDRLHPPTAISDWKTTSEWAEKWLNKPVGEGGGMKAEHRAQLSLYAELVEQSQGWRPTHGVVWYRTHKNIPHFAEPLWSLAETLAFHPLGGEYSVGELIEQAAAGLSWQELPLAGESQAYGTKSACDYCAVKDLCWAQGKGAPF